jgi:4-aminobutyrate aminotransferase-like enzyme
MANENALKLILHKRAPADRIVVFDRGFAGHTLALAELTDAPDSREGLPLRGNVLHVPFYDPEDPQSTEKTLAALDTHLARHPGRVAGMLFEPIQSGGGVHTAPREFFAALMQRCAEAASAILAAAFEEGLLALSAGTDPTKIRMLLPVNTTDEELEAGFTVLEKAIRRVAEARDLAC